MMTFRLVSSRYRVMELLDVMSKEDISKEEKILQLKTELAEHYNELAYFKARTMGQLLKIHLKQTLRKSLLLVPKTNSRFSD